MLLVYKETEICQIGRETNKISEVKVQPKFTEQPLITSSHRLPDSQHATKHVSKYNFQFFLLHLLLQ